MPRSNASRYAILGMLTRGPLSGYDIKKTISESIQHFWNESYGQIYPVLRRLTADGLAVAKKSTQRGNRERRAHALTETGYGELRRWLSAPARYERPRNELLLKLFFGRHIPARFLIKHVEQFRAHHLDLLRRYRIIRKQLPEHHPQDRDLPYWLLTVNLGLRRSAALVLWSDETLRALRMLARRPHRKK